MSQTATQPRRFWRMEDPEFEDGVVVKGGMFDPQRRWWQLDTFVKAFVGGFGAGKTLIAGKRAISLGLANAPVTVAVVSPTLPVARETTVPTIMDLLDGKQRLLGRHAFGWDYHRTYRFFTIRYRGRVARISIKSGEDPLLLRGPNIGAAIIDEPFIQDVEVFRQMHARVRDPRARHREIGLTGTPEQLNWGYDLCVGEMGKKIHGGVGVVNASTRDNKAVGENYVEQLLGVYDGKAAQAFIEGKFVNLSAGQVYYAFDPFENVVDLPVPKSATLGVGMDFNVNPMAAVVFWRAGAHVHVFDEIELPNSDTEYMCQVLRERYWDKGLREVYPDPSCRSRQTNAPGGRTDAHIIEEAGFEVHARPAHPARKDRYNAVNAKFKPAKGRLTLTISSDCDQLKKYLSVYTHELMNKQSQKAMSHLLDAFSYPIEYLFPVKRDRVQVVRLGGL